MKTTLLQAVLWAAVAMAVLLEGAAVAGDVVPASHGCNCNRGHHSAGPPGGPEVLPGPAAGPHDVAAYGAGDNGHWQPGGYEPRSGSPYYYTAGPQYGWHHGDPYTRHFGPGYYRRGERMHFRFPYYNYRAPWYYPGHKVYNRDTNLPW